MSIINAIMAQAAGGFNSPTFVGANSNKAPNGAAVSVDLSGIDIQSGDLIIGAHMAGVGANKLSAMSLSSTGYTEIASHYSAGGYDLCMEVYGKIADGTETAFATNTLSDTTTSVCCIAAVFRGMTQVVPVDSSTGLAASSTILNVDDVTWPSVTGIGLLVYFGATGHATGTKTYTTPTDLSGFITLGENDNVDVTGGFGYTENQYGSYTANTWVMSGSNSLSSVAYTVFKLTK